MARREAAVTSRKGKNSGASSSSRSRAISQQGVKSGRDFAHLMSALMSDLLSGAVDHPTANAVCNAGGKLLKVVEMEQKYGVGKKKTTSGLSLAP